MLGSEDESNAAMLGEPATRVLTCPSADVVGDDLNRATPHPLEYLVEERQDPRYGAAWRRPDEDLAGLDVERGEEVSGALPLVFELDPRRVSSEFVNADETAIFRIL